MQMKVKFLFLFICCLVTINAGDASKQGIGLGLLSALSRPAGTPQNNALGGILGSFINQAVNQAFANGASVIQQNSFGQTGFSPAGTPNIGAGGNNGWNQPQHSHLHQHPRPQNQPQFQPQPKPQQSQPQQPPPQQPPPQQPPAAPAPQEGGVDLQQHPGSPNFIRVIWLSATLDWFFACPSLL